VWMWKSNVSVYRSILSSLFQTFSFSPKMIINFLKIKIWKWCYFFFFVYISVMIFFMYTKKNKFKNLVIVNKYYAYRTQYHAFFFLEFVKMIWIVICIIVFFFLRAVLSKIRNFVIVYPQSCWSFKIPSVDCLRSQSQPAFWIYFFFGFEPTKKQQQTSELIFRGMFCNFSERKHYFFISSSWTKILESEYD